MNKKKYSSELLDEDYEALSRAYNLTVDFLKGMNDDDWCLLIGCIPEELPYYLFGSDALDTMEFFDDFDDPKYIFGEEEDATLFDLSEYLERQFIQEKKVTTSAHDYTRPSVYATKKTKKTPMVVPHHFELVK